MTLKSLSIFEFGPGNGNDIKPVELFNFDTNVWDSSSAWEYNINGEM